MFWTKKNKKTDKQKKKQKLQASNTGNDQKKDQAKSQRIRKEALAHASAARAHIGEDTLNKIAEHMNAMQNSQMAKARAQIQNADPDKMLDEVMFMMRARDDD